MRKKIFAGNWKMNLTANEARTLIAGLRADLDHDSESLTRDREILVAPAFVAIPAASQALAGSSIQLAAQNVHFEDQGAFTGEVSAPMLKPFGVRWVIIGHSERRHIFGENDELISRKILAVLRHNLSPILCVGETLAERDRGRTTEIVLGQVGNDITELTAEQAVAVHRAIRGFLIERGGRETADVIRILYGGSVSPENIDSLMAKPDIDGALVGGASLRADSFALIVRARLS